MVSWVRRQEWKCVSIHKHTGTCISTVQGRYIHGYQTQSLGQSVLQMFMQVRNQGKVD